MQRCDFSVLCFCFIIVELLLLISHSRYLYVSSLIYLFSFLVIKTHNILNKQSVIFCWFSCWQKYESVKFMFKMYASHLNFNFRYALFVLISVISIDQPSRKWQAKSIN